MPQEPRCPSCGHPVRVGATKCPDCGAPIWPEPRRTPDRRPAVAAIILLGLLALNLYQSVVVILDPAAPASQAVGLGGPVFTVSGRLLDANGTSAPNATVSLVDRGGATNRTDAQGRFLLANVSAGFAELRFNGSDNRSVVARLFVARDQTIEATLPAQPGAQAAEDQASYRTLLIVTRVCGGVLLVLGGLTLLGAIACYRRRNWGLALGGSIAGLVASLPLSLLLGGIAIAVVATSRSEFRKA